jgi:hypothetical protein
MASVDVPLKRLRFGQTARKDAWWVMPLVTFVVFTAFVTYTTWALLQGENYYFGNYLSPFYSPELFSPPGHLSPLAWFGTWDWPWFPFVKFSPAMLILVFPLMFRMTCYYYRGAYYKAFWSDPIACTVGEPRSGYRGENKLPLIVQNLHRYALYTALVVAAILATDVWKALWFEDGAGGTHFGIGVGTIILALNVVGIVGYTFGCHSMRHLVGGVLDTMSRAPMRKKAYDCVSCLNARHMRFAWFSLVFVGFSDLYVRMCAMGIWTDYRLF